MFYICSSFLMLFNNLLQLSHFLKFDLKFIYISTNIMTSFSSFRSDKPFIPFSHVLTQSQAANFVCANMQCEVVSTCNIAPDLSQMP